MILGRKSELNQLGNYYDREKSQIIVMYGEKYMGKTSLIKEFMRDKPGFYYCATPASDREQKYKMGQWLASSNIKTLKYPEYSDVFKAFTKIHTQKKVIVFDEFQYIIKSSPDFLPELIKFIHLNWQVQEYLVVLISSSVEFVENSLVPRIGEAAFELSGFMKIKDLSFYDLREYFSFYSKEDCLTTYAVLGGVPGLWNMFDIHMSVKDNIISKILSDKGPLKNVPLTLLNEELRETGVYNTILSGIAEGRKKLNDLYDHTGFSRAKLSVYIKNLMELQFVNKIFSVDTEGRDNVQKGIYDISNHLISFYFTFLYKNTSKLEELSPEEFYNVFVLPYLKSFTDKYFKAACLSHLESLNERNKLPFEISKTGTWVGKQGIIDVVASSEKGENILCACEYEKPMLTYEDYEWLLFTANKAKINPDYIYLYSGGRFDEKLSLEAKVRKNLKLFLLEDM